MVQESWSVFLLRTPKTCKTKLLKKYRIPDYNGNSKMMKIGRGRLKQKTTFLTLFSICIPGILASDIESGSTKSRETSAKATFQPSKLPFIL